MKRTALVLLLVPALLSAPGAALPADAGEASAAVRPAKRSVYVWIEGPQEVYTTGPHVWEAFPSGGTGTYSYEWEVKWDIDPQQQWISAGSDKTASFSVMDFYGNFELRVKVTSGTQVGYASWYVYNMMG
ncbi:MAG: hypothetical protein AB1941_27995 [Gemmatimonadota bacterium]